MSINLEAEKTEDIQAILEELAQIKAREEEIKEQYREKLMEYGVKEIMDDKIKEFFNTTTKQLKTHLKQYFKDYAAIPKGNMFDVSEFVIFNNVVLILLPHRPVIAYDERIPKRLINHIDRFKQLYPFIIQLTTAYTTRSQIAWSRYEYKIRLPEWLSETGKPIIDYIDELEFYKLYIEYHSELTQTIEQILIDLFSVVNVGDIMLDARIKQEKFKADFSE